MFHKGKKSKCWTFPDNILSPQVVQRNQRWWQFLCLTAHGMGWATPPQQQCAQAYPAWGGERSPQTSAERGERGGCYVGLSQGRTGACEPTSVWTVGFDLKGVPTEGQCEHFPNLWQQPIFVLFKCKDLVNALGCDISRADLENWSSCSPVAIESAGMRGQSPAVVLAQPRPS